MASVIQSLLSRAMWCWGQSTTDNSSSLTRTENAKVREVLRRCCWNTCLLTTLVVGNSFQNWRCFWLCMPLRTFVWKVIYKRTYLLLTYLFNQPVCSKSSLTSQIWTFGICLFYYGLDAAPVTNQQCQSTEWGVSLTHLGKFWKESFFYHVDGLCIIPYVSSV